jgi:hypothetical protein
MRRILRSSMLAHRTLKVGPMVTASELWVPAHPAAGASTALPFKTCSPSAAFRLA